MPELEPVHKEGISRRGFLRLVPKVAAGAAIGLGAAAIPDRNSRVESFNNKELITSVFGDHSVGYASTLSEYDLGLQSSDGGELGDIHMWPNNVRRELGQIKPEVIAIDGLNSTGLDPKRIVVDQRFWYMLPEDPFMLKGDRSLKIVAADLPFDFMYDFKHKVINLDYDPVGAKAVPVFIDHYEKSNGESIDADINYPVSEGDLESYFNRKKYEWIVSTFGLGGLSLAYLAAKPGILQKSISRREALRVGAVGTLGLLNSARLMGDYITDDMSGSYDLLYAPISGLPQIAEHALKLEKYLKFRNALIAAKLDEVSTTSDGSHVKSVAIMGSGHGLVENVWDNKPLRDKVLRDNFEEIFKLLEGLSPSDKERTQMLAVANQFYGGMQIYEVGKTPDKITIETLKNNVQVAGGNISAAVAALAKEAAIAVGFIKEA